MTANHRAFRSGLVIACWDGRADRSKSVRLSLEVSVDMNTKIILQATSKDETPTPGHLLADIARITQDSDEAAGKLDDYLFKRLKKEANTQIKLKTLRVIKYCCEAGHPSFRKLVQRRTVELREFIGESHRLTASPLPRPPCTF